MYWNAIRLDGNENVFGSFASQLHSVAGGTMESISR